MTFKLQRPTAKDFHQRQRRANGELTEQLVERQHIAAAVRGIAHVTKRPTPFKVLGPGRGNELRVVPERSAGVDYQGVLRDGRAVYVEVKRCTSGTFPLDRIEGPQRQEMERASALGALCVLLVVWSPDTDKGRALVGAGPVLCPVHWSVVRERIERDEASIDSEQLADCAEAFKGKNYLEAMASRFDR